MEESTVKAKARLLSLDEDHWVKLKELAVARHGAAERNLSKVVRELIEAEWDKLSKTN